MPFIDILFLKRRDDRQDKAKSTRQTGPVKIFMEKSRKTRSGRWLVKATSNELNKKLLEVKVAKYGRARIWRFLEELGMLLVIDGEVQNFKIFRGKEKDQNLNPSIT